jgi:hypothetical protein
MVSPHQDFSHGRPRWPLPDRRSRRGCTPCISVLPFLVAFRQTRQDSTLSDSFDPRGRSGDGDRHECRACNPCTVLNRFQCILLPRRSPNSIRSTNFNGLVKGGS